MLCRNCKPPCSYKEENESGICPFKRRFDVFMEYLEDNCDLLIIPGNLFISETCWGDFSSIIVDGDCVIEGDVSSQGITINGNLIVDGYVDVSNHLIEVKGDLIIRDDGHLEAGNIIVDGDVFLFQYAELEKTELKVQGEVILL